DSGVAIYLHESLLQGIVDRSELAGRKTTNQELLRQLSSVGLTVEMPPLTAGLSDLDVEIEFDRVNPLVIRVGEDETRVIFRASFNPVGHHLFPHFEVTIPYRLIKRDENWVLKPGPVEVRKLAGGEPDETLTERAVKKVLDASLPSVSFPQQLPATLWPEG